MVIMHKTRRVVKRNSAETNILISLILFGLTVVILRVFLQLAGYSQVGNSGATYRACDLGVVCCSSSPSC